MISEFDGLPGQLKVGHHITDDLPCIRQRPPHTVNEVGVINLAALGTLKQSEGNLKRHYFVPY
jgi:hypothetical protein